ncbi:MAG: hypothetical protein FWE57_06490 [Chitinispirillia bacterium]|nr:hypothetical protein [Chitinispirillia bacterium]
MTAVIFFINCASNSHSKIVVSPDFTKHPLINAVLAFVILDETPEVIYNGNVERALGQGNTEELARRFFHDRLFTDISNEVDVKTVFSSSGVSKHLITKEALELENEIITIEIPMNGTKFDFGATQADLVLTFSSIRIGTETSEHYHTRVDHGINTRVGRHLVYISNFVLWDNRTGTLISYGRVKSRVPIRGSESVVSEWEELSKQFVRKIFEPAGFLKRSRNK